MSTAIAKNFQIGADSTATNNFTLFQPVTPDGTLRIGNGNTGITASLLALTSAGNLGIGTSSPGYKLHVQNSAANTDMFVGQSSTVGLFTQWRYNATTASAYGEISTYGGNNPVYIQAQSGGGNTILNWLSGNVGIGTNSVASLGSSITNLHIVGKSTGRGGGIRLQSTDASLDAAFYVADGAVELQSISNTPMVFRTNSIERARIDSSGNLLVGTTSSTAPNPGFSVYVAGAGNTQAIIGHSTASGSGQAYITFQYNGATTIGSVTQSGTTAVAYNTTSDHRLKNNVRTADALRFKDIRFVDFEWVDGRHDCGVIAHELQAIYPDLVVGTKDETEVRTVELTPAVPAVLDEEGNVVTPEVPAVTEEQTFDKHQQVNYIGLIPRMGTVIQQLMAKVDAMEAEIAALKAAP